MRTGCHGATDLSPVCMGAALHFDTWVPNFGIQEYMRHTAGDRRGLPARLLASRTATCIRATTPGHGVDIDEKLAAKYPYEPRLSAGRAAGGRHADELVSASAHLSGAAPSARLRASLTRYGGAPQMRDPACFACSQTGVPGLRRSISLRCARDADLQPVHPPRQAKMQPGKAGGEWRTAPTNGRDTSQRR